MRLVYTNDTLSRCWTSSTFTMLLPNDLWICTSHKLSITTISLLKVRTNPHGSRDEPPLGWPLLCTTLQDRAYSYHTNKHIDPAYVLNIQSMLPRSEKKMYDPQGRIGTFFLMCSYIRIKVWRTNISHASLFLDTIQLCQRTRAFVKNTTLILLNYSINQLNLVVLGMHQVQPFSIIYQDIFFMKDRQPY
jgi:hypothetical protein